MILHKTTYNSLIDDYLNLSEKTSFLYNFLPNMKGIESYLSNKQFDKKKREVLYQSLKKQYQNDDVDYKTLQNIELLKEENTFTITTGHQLCVLTGPLFSIYKICSVIKLCEQLKETFPHKNFVPVFWLASEDHDKEEINHFHLFGKKYIWETNQKGAVGRFSCKGLSELFQSINEDLSEFTQFYNENSSLSESTKKIIHHIFKNTGLVVIEPDDVDLKKEFIPIITRELIEQQSYTEINKTNNQLLNLGYKPQLNARPINLFYIENNIRERIVYDNERFTVQNTDYEFTQDEIVLLAQNHPEKFSPNAALRPVYQERILPNISYIGGPGELSYWLQLKSTFDLYNVEFPVVLLRDSFMILTKNIQKNIQKLQLNVTDVFKDFQTLRKQVVLSSLNQPFEIENEKSNLQKILNTIKIKIEDKSLHASIEVIQTKLDKDLKNIENKVFKFEEQRNEQLVSTLEKTIEKLFPNQTPQERHDNFLQFYLNNPDFIRNILQLSNPLLNGVKIIMQ